MNDSKKGEGFCGISLLFVIAYINTIYSKVLYSVLMLWGDESTFRISSSVERLKSPGMVFFRAAAASE